MKTLIALELVSLASLVSFAHLQYSRCSINYSIVATSRHGRERRCHQVCELSCILVHRLRVRQPPWRDWFTVLLPRARITLKNECRDLELLPWKSNDDCFFVVRTKACSIMLPVCQQHSYQRTIVDVVTLGKINGIQNGTANWVDCWNLKYCTICWFSWSNSSTSQH